MRVSQTVGLKTRGDITAPISDHQSSPVNFPLYLVPRKFGNFGKFASPRPRQSALNWAVCRLLATAKPVTLRTGPGTGYPLGGGWSAGG
jgi:hypothetical protein